MACFDRLFFVYYDRYHPPKINLSVTPKTLPSIVPALVSYSRLVTTRSQLSILLQCTLSCAKFSSTYRLFSRWYLRQYRMSTAVRRESGVDTSDLQTTQQSTSRDDDEREATELGPVQHGHSDTVATISTTSAFNVDVKSPIPGGLRRWWKHYIQLHVPHATCRDHLGVYTDSDMTLSWFTLASCGRAERDD